MSDRGRIVGAIEAHCRSLTGMDREGWLKIWADNATLEDPVGVETFQGIDVLGSNFWGIVETISPMSIAPLERVLVCGNEAIAILASEVTRDGRSQEVGPLVDHFCFDSDGKIASMRAYWDFAAVGYRPEMAPDATSRDRMVAAIETHCRSESTLDKSTWLTLFADDILIEDPVGLASYQGLEALESDFWTNVERARPQVRLTNEVIVCGNEAAAMLSAEIDNDGQRVTVSPIVALFVFNEAGKIRHLRAFMDFG